MGNIEYGLVLCVINEDMSVSVDVSLGLVCDFICFCIWFLSRLID